MISLKNRAKRKEKGENERKWKKGRERQMGERREEDSEKKTELKLFYLFCSFWLVFSQEVDKRCRLLIN